MSQRGRHWAKDGFRKPNSNIPLCGHVRSVLIPIFFPENSCDSASQMFDIQYSSTKNAVLTTNMSRWKMGLIWKSAYKEEWERRHQTLIRDSSVLVKWHQFVSGTYECSFQMLWWHHAAHFPDLIRELHALCEHPMLQLLSRRAEQGMQKRKKRSAFSGDE